MTKNHDEASVRVIRFPQVSKRQARAAAEANAATGRALPMLREECVSGERPCPFVSCRYHLFLDVNPKTGSITLNFPSLAPDELGESCALDVADHGGASPEELAPILNLSRERIRQIEVGALAQLELRGARRLLNEES